MHSKENRKQTTEIDANIGNRLRVDTGNGGRGKGKIGEGGKLRMFNILIWVIVNGVYTCQNSSKCALVCAFYCMYFTLK